jgi:hypothetical protein
LGRNGLKQFGPAIAEVVKLADTLCSGRSAHKAWGFKSPLRHFIRNILYDNYLAFSFVVTREFIFTLEDRLESRLYVEEIVTLPKSTKFLTYK